MKKEFWITLIVIILAVGLVVGVILANKLTPDVPGETVAHDHNGDGIPDHGADEHETVPHDHDGDGIPDHDDSAHTDSGSAQGSTPTGNAGGGDSDVDISIDLEDVPDGTTPTTPSTGTEPTTPSTGTTEPSTPGTGNPVNGNEIDFDDLQNAGKN